MSRIYDQLIVAVLNVIMVLNEVAYASFHQTPPWDTASDLQDCTIAQNVKSNTLRIDATSNDQTCSIVYSRDIGNRTMIQMQRANIKETDYLFVKRDNAFGVASYVGLVNTEQSENYACCMSFVDKDLTFYLRGNISVLLQKTLTDESNVQCAESPQHPSIQNWRNVSVCTEIKEYASLLRCYHRSQPHLVEYSWEARSNSYLDPNIGWKDDTRCDIICQAGCNCTLDDRQVAYLCSKQEILHSTVIAYPSNVSNLNFSHNNLSTITSVAFLTIAGNLKKLDLAFNHLVHIHTAFNMLTNLQVLYLNSNNITHLSNNMFQNLTNLHELDLSINDLMKLEHNVFHNLHSLSYLFLFDNQFREIEEGTFTPLTNLLILDLKHNLLESLQDGIFRGLYNLTNLNLRFNLLQNIQSNLFQDLYSLQNLHLGHNHLSSLEEGAFNRLSALQVLEINHNNIVSFHDDIFHGLSNLQAIILAKNLLETLKAKWFVGLDNLHEVEVWGNNIHTLEPGVFRHLKHLNLTVRLQGNELETLTAASFEGLITLHTLDLYSNILKTVQSGVFDNLVGMKKLILAKNRLAYLPPDLFKNSANLRFLDLSENRLLDLPFIGHLSSLKDLIIKDNRLDYLNGDVFYMLPDTVKVIVTQPEICICLLNGSNENCKAAGQESPYLTCQKMLPDMVLVVFMWVGGFGAIFGNALVLFWRKTQPQEEYQVQKMLIGNLALADLLMGMYMVVIASADVHYGEFFPINSQIWRTSTVCSVTGALAITSSEASIMLLTVISIDRLIHIKYQMNKRKPRINTTKWTALSVWLFALIIALVASLQSEGKGDVYEPSNVCVGLPLAMNKVHLKNETCFNQNSYTLSSESFYEYWDCENEEIALLDDTVPGMYLSITIFLGLNLLCCVTIVACYIAIVITVFRSVSQIRRQRHMRHEIRMTTKVVAIIATDLCCWCPIILTSILVQADVVKISPRMFVWIVTFILPINSVINPYLYTLGNVIADRLPKAGDRSGSASRNTNTTNVERPSRPEPTNYASQYAIDDNDFKAPLVEKKPFVLMETCV